MTHHTDEQLQDLFDEWGALASTKDPHMASCAQCRGMIERLASLEERLRALPREAMHVPPLRRRSSWTRWLAAAAAALLIFFAGFAAGKTNRKPQTSADPVVEIQRTGTEYAAAIARVSPSGNAYEVARSTLYGAANEVSRLAPPADATAIRLSAQALDLAPKHPIDF